MEEYAVRDILDKLCRLPSRRFQVTFVKGVEVKLAAKDRAGFYCRSAVSSADPALFNIQPAEFLT